MSVDTKTVYDKPSAKGKDIFDSVTVHQLGTLLKSSYWDDKPFVVFIASSWDLMHAGHCLMLDDAMQEAQARAKKLHKGPPLFVVGLHSDPTLNRSAKNKPIQSLHERRIMIASNRNVDAVIDYATEDDLYKLLSNLKIDLRVLGSDWKGQKFTGHDLDIPVYFHDRSHSYSTSNLRKRVYEAENALIQTAMGSRYVLSCIARRPLL